MSAHCFFCGGLVAADGACDICGIRRLALDEKRIGARCPRCAAAHLGPVKIGEIVVQGCARCNGLFVAATEWDAILDRSPHSPLPQPVPLRVASAPVRVEPTRDTHPYRGTISSAVLDRESAAPAAIDLERAVACPVCRENADRVEFAGGSRAFVDVCSLHGIWLDGGELAKVVKVARENPAVMPPDWRFSPREEELHKLILSERAPEPSLARLVLRALVRRFRRYAT